MDRIQARTQRLDPCRAGGIGTTQPFTNPQHRAARARGNERTEQGQAHPVFPVLPEGQVVAIVEAMKMMNEIRAHKAGSIASVHANPGATVEAQAALVTIVLLPIAYLYFKYAELTMADAV